MTHKVHPKLYRIKELNDWQTRGYYKRPAESLEEDFIVREFLKERIGKFGVEKVEIERFPNRLNIIIFSARPGLIIGRGGEEIEKIRKELEKRILRKTKNSPFRALAVKLDKKENKSSSAKTSENKEIKIEIREIKDYWASASLSAQWVAQQLEKRIPFRRVLKQGLGKIMANRSVKGARIEISGRLNGSDMSRREWLLEGELPRSTIRADLDYAKAEAYCTYGVIGIKVWIYKGEKFD